MTPPTANAELLHLGDTLKEIKEVVSDIQNRMQALELREAEQDVERLAEYARNPSKNDDQIDRIVGAIREFGFRIGLAMVGALMLFATANDIFRKLLG